MSRSLKDVMSDIVIGMSDGLTVPFALAAGLSSLHNTHIVVVGGTSEIVAGMISMGLGGYQEAKIEDEFDGTDKSKRGDEMKSGLTVGLSYMVGGIIPMIPYVFTNNAVTAEIISIILTLVALFVFGLVKGKVTKRNKLRSALETVVTGGIATAVAFICAKLVNGM